jgi:hypothetical protein
VTTSTLKVLGEAQLTSPAALDEALDEAQREGRNLGAVLVQRGAVTSAVWQRFMQRELERLLYRLFSLKDAQFSFKAAEFPTLPPLTFNLPIDRAVLTGSRWAEAWSHLQPAVPSPHAVYAATAPSATVAADLPAPDQGVLLALDRPTEVVRVATQVELSVIETAQALARLVAAGRVRLVSAG